jgi:hypothetical protein
MVKVVSRFLFLLVQVVVDYTLREKRLTDNKLLELFNVSRLQDITNQMVAFLMRDDWNKDRKLYWHRVENRIYFEIYERKWNG